jgi:hypothetical protein
MVVVAVLLTAGCAGTPGEPGSVSGPAPESVPSSGVASTDAPPVGPPTTEVPPGTARGGSTSGGRPASAAPPAPGGACPPVVSVRVAVADAVETVCVAVTGSLRWSADSPAWHAVVSSNPTILSCASRSGSGTCTPHLPGTVTVSATAGQSRWELRVNVVAYGMN